MIIRSQSLYAGIMCTLIVLMLDPNVSDAGDRKSKDIPSSRYMGGPVELVEAPNGAIVNATTLEVNPKITYVESTVEVVDPRKSETTDTVVLARGDSKETIAVSDMFDRFAPTKNFTIPPMED